MPGLGMKETSPIIITWREEHQFNIDFCYTDIGYLLRHRCEYITGIIERGCGRETDKARFSKLTTEGKVKAALRLITDQERGGLLPLDSVASSDGTTTKTIRDILLEKHPSAICEPSESFHEPHSVHFD